VAGHATKIRFLLETLAAAMPVIFPELYALPFAVPFLIIAEVKGCSSLDVLRIPQKYPYLKGVKV